VKFSNGNWRYGSALAVLALSIPAGAFAETALLAEPLDSSAGGSGLSEIVVTARKRAENTQDVPLSISTVSGREIGFDGDYSIQNIAEKAPNLLISPSNPRQTSISVRGLGKNSANDGLETSVGVYVDGVYLSQPGQTAFDLADLDQIEVIRGPQGTLFGKNNTGGLLNITTLKPSFDSSSVLEVIDGDYGTKELHASTTGALTDDSAFRVTAYDKKRAGFLTNLYDGNRVNGLDRQGVRGQYLLQATPDLTLRLIAEYYQSSEFGAGGTVLWNPQITYADGTLAPYSKTTPAKTFPLGYTPVFDPWARVVDANNTTPTLTSQEAVTLLANYNGGSYAIDSISAFRHYTFENLGDGDSTPLDITTYGGTKSRNSQYSQELRLSSTGERFIDYVAGAYFYHDDLWSDTHNQAGALYAAYNKITLTNPTALAGLRADTIGEPIVDSYAVFAQGDLHATDKLTVTGGLRETREHKSADIVESGTGGANPSTLNAADLAQRLGYAPIGSTSAFFTQSALSWTTGLNYKLADNVNSYLTVSKGFKSGGINVEVVTGPLVVAPETALDYEAGIKSEWLDKRLRVNANLYNEKINNYQGTFTYDLTPTTTANYIANVGDVRVRGAELEVQAQPVDALLLSTGLAYNEATYLNFTNGGCPPEYGDIKGLVCNFSGRTLPFAPRLTGNVAAKYTLHLTGDLQAYAGADAVIRSAQNVNTSLSSYGEQGGYTLGNVQLGIAKHTAEHDYDVSLWARNVFDKQYLTSVGGNATLTAGLGDPRTWGATLRVKF
jgi:iron complex outermembrane receptor protein